MNIRIACSGLLLLLFTALPPLLAQQVPGPLAGWEGWATWEHQQQATRPSRYDDRAQPMPLWFGELEIEADAQGARFSYTVQARGPGLAPLPGDASCWPQGVEVNGEACAVLGREGAPVVPMPVGSAGRVTGVFRWTQMPQSLLVPQQAGILRLRLNGQPVEQPVRDEAGRLWLQRTGTEPADRDFLSMKVSRLLEDGSPQWLHTQVELRVAGKSREEVLGHALPEGWRLSWVECPLPCAVDEAGKLKAQVRAGRWVVKLAAWRTTPATTVAYAAGLRPLAGEELVGLRQDTGLRLVEIGGIPAVDVAQTSYPAEWRQHPVHLWTTDQPFQIVEKMRGMGSRKPPGMSLTRQFWLDEDGGGLTYRDLLSGGGQQTWRLDAAAGHSLGAVKIGGQGQLITRNPATGAEGVEVRDRNLDLDAVGRIQGAAPIPATGWLQDAESLSATLHLPPGWRLLAVFGPDWSVGDWLTAWTLFDVFMLLITILALARLWGWKTALVGLVCFLLCFQEAGAPRLAAVLLISALAAARLLEGRVPPALPGRLRAVALGIFALGAAPFVIQQVQQALYPQLELGRGQVSVGFDSPLELEAAFQTAGLPGAEAAAAPPVAAGSLMRKAANLSPEYQNSPKPASQAIAKLNSNLIQDTKARIQTGPAVPQWTWRQASFGWRGPVSAGEGISLWLVPCGVERLISLARVALLLGLLWLLLRGRAGLPGWPTAPPAPSAAPPPVAPVPTPAASAASLGVAVLLLACFLAAGPATAQQAAEAAPPTPPQAGMPAAAPAPGFFPPQEMLEKLRQRVLADSAALELQVRAELPHVRLRLDGRRLEMEAEIHAAELVAVPLPGRLPGWTPLGIQGGLPTLRHEGHLWVLAAPGISRVRVTGLLPPGPEWQWSFLLKPRQVSIDAPGWTITGLKPGGVPEDQVFFAEQKPSTAGEAAYDQKNYQPIVRIERELELGLVWQVRTRVARLSPTGKAISLSLPLLPGERVMSAGMTASAGRMEVRLGAADAEVSWLGELSAVEKLELKAETNAEGWVERWSLHTSPIWHVETQGLEPVYEPQQSLLVPVWQPWPGETVTLSVSRPEAVLGATTTVLSASQTTRLGDRQHNTELSLQVQASLGEDFRLELPGGAEITALSTRGQELPVRREKDAIIIPLRPGIQKVDIAWKTAAPLGLTARPDAVRLPVALANLRAEVHMPASRWLLWAGGPRQGPAVRFWGMAIAAALFGWLLARLPLSPLRGHQWALLLLGFLQLPLIIGCGVVLWFLALAWRGSPASQRLRGTAMRHNLAQLALLAASGIALLCMLAVVHEGLLGRPEMFVSGNGSSAGLLRWFQARMPDGVLPRPVVVSVSVWYYRALMLLWALWLARSVLRWLPWAWQQLSVGGFWKKSAPAPQPPPLP